MGEKGEAQMSNALKRIFFCFLWTNVFFAAVSVSAGAFSSFLALFQTPENVEAAATLRIQVINNSIWLFVIAVIFSMTLSVQGKLPGTKPIARAPLKPVTSRMDDALSSA